MLVPEVNDMDHKKSLSLPYHLLTPGSYQRLDLFIKVLRVLCPNLTDASMKNVGWKRIRGLVTSLAGVGADYKRFLLAWDSIISCDKRHVTNKES